jgi:AraC family transcriptional regulator
VVEDFMAESVREWMTVEAEVRVPLATAQLVQLHVTEPCDLVMMDRDAYWLDMCLSPRPRNTRLRYRDRWSSRRFERMGKVYFLPPAEEVQIRSDGGCDHASIFCHINPEPVREWLGSDAKWKNRQFEASLDIANSNVRGLLLRLAEELKQPGFASEVLVELISAQLAVELGRYFINFADVPAAQELAPWRLKLIDEFIRDEQRVPSLSELAGLCHLSIRQLTRGFRASRGCSIGEYMASARVEQAKRLLRGDQSIKTIAYSLGFSTPSGFCSAFRRATGMTPGEFRAARIAADF